MRQNTEIICAGFGGQGVLTTGLILAKTAMDEGDHVTWIPSYGSEMRGGTANCGVKISQSPISSPFIEKCSVLMALNVPSVEKFMNHVAPGGLLLVNTSLVKNIEFRKDIRVTGVDAAAIAEEIGSGRVINIVILGAFASMAVLYDADRLREGMLRFFQEKGKANAKNEAAFNEGFARSRVL